MYEAKNRPASVPRNVRILLSTRVNSCSRYFNRDSGGEEGGRDG